MPSAPIDATASEPDTLGALPPLAGYGPGVPRKIQVPEVTLIEVLNAASRDHGPKPALDFFGRVTSYADLRAQVTAAAQVLRDAGVTPGDRVALLLPSCPQAVVAFYAVLEAGGVVVAQNPLYTSDEVRRLFLQHEATVAVVWDKAADALAALDLPAPPRVFTVDMSRAMPPLKRLALRLPLAKARAARTAMTTTTRVGASWDDAVRAALRKAPSAPAPAHAGDPRDVALLLFTGGTTGAPKAAMLTHRNLVANVTQSRAWVPHLKEGEEVFYGVLPIFHAYGMSLCLLASVRMGACLVMFPRFDADQVLDAMKRRPATFLPGVPPIYAKLADAVEKRGGDLSSIRVALSGAMPLPPELVERWEKLTGGYLIEGYGMTETAPIALGNPLAPTRQPGSVGLPFPSTEIRLVDPENPAVERGPGEPGELLIRGPQVFAGYWNNREQTDEILLPGGWLRTGDVAEMDEAGFVRIVDRIKDLIITGGFNVYPSEVEDQLREHPSVEDAAVIGVPGADGSEDVHAAIVLSPGEDLDAEELRAYLRQRMAGYKVPKSFQAVDDLPRSAVGKVLRKDVRAEVRGAEAQGA